MINLVQTYSHGDNFTGARRSSVHHQAQVTHDDNDYHDRYDDDNDDDHHKIKMMLSEGATANNPLPYYPARLSINPESWSLLSRYRLPSR